MIVAKVRTIFRTGATMAMCRSGEPEVKSSAELSHRRRETRRVRVNEFERSRVSVIDDERERQCGMKDWGIYEKEIGEI